MRLLWLLHRMARHAGFLRPWCLMVGVLAVCSALYAALTDSSPESWQLRLSLILGFQSLMLYAFLQLFRELPPPVLPQLGWFERARDRLLLLLYQGLALLVAGLTLLLLHMSLKLLLL